MLAWFDYITYTPSANVLTGDFMFTATDPSMKYSGEDWQISSIGTFAEQKGAKLSFDFFGEYSFISFFRSRRQFNWAREFNCLDWDVQQ